MRPVEAWKSRRRARRWMWNFGGNAEEGRPLEADPSGRRTLGEEGRRQGGTCEGCCYLLWPIPE